MKSVWPLTMAMILLLPSLAQTQVPWNRPWQETAGVLQSTAVDAGGYVRFNFPRSDLQVVVGDVPIPASFALTSWIGFAGTPESASAMGDLVVTASELGPVLAELSRRSVEVTAVHNHLGGERPRITYIHYHVMGTAPSIARTLDAVLRLTGAPRPVARMSTAAVTIDTALVFATLGKSGKGSGALAQLSFLLVPGTVTMHGETIVPGLGYGSPINLLQVAANRAVTTGDFAITEAQLSPLVTALAAGGITVTAVHNHLVSEVPRIYYVHFWGDDTLPHLVQALRTALDAVRAH